MDGGQGGAQRGGAALGPPAQIAGARCDFEQRCGNIGPGQEYASTEACLTQVMADWREDLNPYECPGGYDQEALQRCVTEIRTAACGSPIDALTRFAACRPGEICID